MRKQGLPMVPKPDNNGRTQQSPHLHRKQVSPLFQSLLYATSLSQDLHYYLFLLTERNLKTIFASSIQHLFCSELLQRQCTTPSGKSSTVRLLPWEPHSISASSPRALNCVHEHLGFTSIYSVCTLTGCVPTYLPLRFTSFWFTEVIMGKALPSDGRRKTSYSKITVLFHVKMH